jgi:hypothetical protein
MKVINFFFDQIDSFSKKKIILFSNRLNEEFDSCDTITSICFAKKYNIYLVSPIFYIISYYSIFIIEIII